MNRNFFCFILILSLCFLECEISQSSSYFCSNVLRKVNWDPAQFSDPKNHDINNFQYIIHSLAKGATAEEYLSFFIERLKQENYLLSASVINQNHQQSYGMINLILEAPMNSIVRTDQKDTWVVNDLNIEPLYFDSDGKTPTTVFNNQTQKRITFEEYVEWLKKARLMSPEELIEKSMSNSFNEVVIDIALLSKKSIAGVAFSQFYYDEKPVGLNKFHRERELASELANLIGVPLIEIRKNIPEDMKPLYQKIIED